MGFVLAACAALAAGAGGAIVAGSGIELLEIQSVSVSGSSVIVTLHNAGGTAVSGAVSATGVTMIGTVERVTEPIHLGPDEIGTLTLDFSAPLTGLTDVGVHEDPNPF